MSAASVILDRHAQNWGPSADPFERKFPIARVVAGRRCISLGAIQAINGPGHPVCGSKACQHTGIGGMSWMQGLGHALALKVLLMPTCKACGEGNRMADGCFIAV